MDRQTPHLVATGHPPRLLNQVSARLRTKHYSIRTERAYCDWVKRFVLFHDKRHPKEMGVAEIEAFLTHLAVAGRVAASTQNQAKSALLFLYREVLHVDLPWLDNITQAKTPQRLPVVLTPSETKRVLDQLEGTRWLMASLLYGGGLTSAIAEPSPRTWPRAKNRSPSPDRPE
jgi:site-specific recombinase XerD